MEKMENNIICKNCGVENVVIESQLFFSEPKFELDIMCPNCNLKIQTKQTDGWFFIQTLEQFIFEKKIEEQKKYLKFDNTY